MWRSNFQHTGRYPQGVNADLQRAYEQLVRLLDGAAVSLRKGDRSRSRTQLAACVALCCDLRYTTCGAPLEHNWTSSPKWDIGKTRPKRYRHDDRCNPPVATHVGAALKAAGFKRLGRQLLRRDSWSTCAKSFWHIYRWAYQYKYGR